MTLDQWNSLEVGDTIRGDEILTEYIITEKCKNLNLNSNDILYFYRTIENNIIVNCAVYNTYTLIRRASEEQKSRIANIE